MLNFFPRDRQNRSCVLGHWLFPVRSNTVWKVPETVHSIILAREQSDKNKEIAVSKLTRKNFDVIFNQHAKCGRKKKNHLRSSLLNLGAEVVNIRGERLNASFEPIAISLEFIFTFSRCLFSTRRRDFRDFEQDGTGLKLKNYGRKKIAICEDRCVRSKRLTEKNFFSQSVRRPVPITIIVKANTWSLGSVITTSKLVTPAAQKTSEFAREKSLKHKKQKKIKTLVERKFNLICENSRVPHAWIE